MAFLERLKCHDAVWFIFFIWNAVRMECDGQLLVTGAWMGRDGCVGVFHGAEDYIGCIQSCHY